MFAGHQVILILNAEQALKVSERSREQAERLGKTADQWRAERKSTREDPLAFDIASALGVELGCVTVVQGR